MTSTIGLSSISTPFPSLSTAGTFSGFAPFLNSSAFITSFSLTSDASAFPTISSSTLPPFGNQSGSTTDNPSATSLQLQPSTSDTSSNSPPPTAISEATGQLTSGSSS